MKNIKGRITACCLALVMTGTPLVLSGCNSDKKIVCEVGQSQTIGFDKFSETISFLTNYVGDNYEYGNEHDLLYGFIAEQSEFEGINNPITMAFLKQYISDNGMVFDFDKEFMDETTGDITIKTSRGTLKYSSIESDGNRFVTANVTVDREIEDSPLEKTTYSYNASCNVRLTATKKGEVPTKVKISAEYATKKQEIVPYGEPIVKKGYVCCEDVFNVVKNRDRSYELDHGYGILEAHDPLGGKDYTLTDIDSSDMLNTVTNLFVSEAPISSAISMINKDRGGNVKTY